MKNYELYAGRVTNTTETLNARQYEEYIDASWDAYMTSSRPLAEALSVYYDSVYEARRRFGVGETDPSLLNFAIDNSGTSSERGLRKKPR